MREEKISANQLFTLAFLTRVIIMLTVDFRLAGGKNLQDLTLSSICYLVLNLIFILPAWFLRQHYSSLDILAVSRYAFGKTGAMAGILYAIYLLFMNSYFLSVFGRFMESEINSQISVWIILTALLIAAVYGAFLGLESIARTAGFLLIFAAIGMGFLLISLNQELRSENYTPLLYNGVQQTGYGTLLLLSRSSFYSVILLLLPRTEGKLKRNYVFWNIGLSLFFIVIILTVCGTLGPVAGSENFPVYTMSSLAHSGPFQRLDAIYTGVWMMGLFLSTALDLYLISLCISSTFGEKTGKYAAAAAAVFLVIFSNTWGREALFRIEIILPATLITGVGIPIAALIFAGRKRRRYEER